MFFALRFPVTQREVTSFDRISGDSFSDRNIEKYGLLAGLEI